MSTDAIAAPAVPSDHASEDRSRQGAIPSLYSCCTTTKDMRIRAAGRIADVQTPEMPLAGRLSAALATVRS